MRYKYYSLLRPVGIGTYPKDGMTGFKNYDRRTYIPSIDHEAWGEIYYSKRLDEKTIFSYDFMAERTNEND